MAAPKSGMKKRCSIQILCEDKFLLGGYCVSSVWGIATRTKAVGEELHAVGRNFLSLEENPYTEHAGSNG